MIQWYVFQSKIHNEQLLCEQLRIRHIEKFFPYIRVWPANPRARKIKPYFPGYVFGRVDLELAGKSLVSWIPGAIGVVSFGGEPASVSDHFIHILRQHIETINTAAGRISERFQRGDIVTVHGGPLAGYEAIFDTHLSGHERVEVLLKLLEGYQLRVQLPVSQIALRS